MLGMSKQKISKLVGRAKDEKLLKFTKELTLTDAGLERVPLDEDIPF